MDTYGYIWMTAAFPVKTTVSSKETFIYGTTSYLHGVVGEREGGGRQEALRGGETQQQGHDCITTTLAISRSEAARFDDATEEKRIKKDSAAVV